MPSPFDIYQFLLDQMRDAVKVIRYDGQARLSMVTRIRLAGHKSLVVRH
jgi:hypothetical protein